MSGTSSTPQASGEAKNPYSKDAMEASIEYLYDSARCYPLTPHGKEGDYCRFDDACVAIQKAFLDGWVAAWCMHG